MNYWLLLADPKAYGFDDLERDKKTVWDGISGSLAQKHLRAFKKGDMALVYHTAPDKAVIGAASVLSDPYPDPKDPEGKLVVVDLQAIDRLKKPVPLQALRPRFLLPVSAADPTSSPPALPTRLCHPLSL